MEDYNEMAFDKRQYDEHDDVQEISSESYDELMDYNRLTLGTA